MLEVLAIVALGLIVGGLMHMHDDIRELRDAHAAIAFELTRLKVKAHLEQMMAARDS